MSLSFTTLRLAKSQVYAYRMFSYLIIKLFLTDINKMNITKSRKY